MWVWYTSKQVYKLSNNFTLFTLEAAFPSRTMIRLLTIWLGNTTKSIVTYNTHVSYFFPVGDRIFRRKWLSSPTKPVNPDTAMGLKDFFLNSAKHLFHNIPKKSKISIFLHTPKLVCLDSSIKNEIIFFAFIILPYYMLFLYFHLVSSRNNYSRYQFCHFWPVLRSTTFLW